MTNKTTSAIDLVERLDLPEAFEAWWQPCRHKNREPITDYNRKKQLAFDAFQAGVHAARIEAADTITRLQAALEHIAEEGDAETSASVQLEGCKQIAREALSVGGE